jgi:hypothetical protein
MEKIKSSSRINNWHFMFSLFYLDSVIHQSNAVIESEPIIAPITVKINSIIL